MVNNQIEFNNEYPKEKENIRIASGGKFEGQLIIEDYPYLKKVFLKDFSTIDKMILKDLTNLQECTI